MLSLNGQTALYGIMGYPVEHSLSPMFQNKFLQDAAENAVYLPFSVAPNDIEQALSGLAAAHIQGINVTVPHKECVLPLVDADADALAIGAVNTLKRTSKGWQACNTDWLGFSEVLQGLAANVSTAPVLLFGAGGTSRAVCHALHHQGTKELWLCNRSPERAKALVADLKIRYPAMKSHVLPWRQEDVEKTSYLCRTIINSSSIGLHEDDTFPFELQGEGVAVDAVYKPSGQTAFGHAATLGGFAAVDGLPMLIAQGIASFAFWHQEALADQRLNLPDKLLSLQWVEQQLARQPVCLPGWRT
ncbi:MAG: shikimate dehydrogenase [Ghiorsea sp.]